MLVNCLSRYHFLRMPCVRCNSLSTSGLYSFSRICSIQSLKMITESHGQSDKRTLVTQSPSYQSHKLKTESKLKEEWVYDQNGIQHKLVKSNQNFEKYYYLQKTCSSETEWRECLAAMRRELPQGFLVELQRSSISHRLISFLKEASAKQMSANDNSESERIALTQKSWCPKGSIWQLVGTSRWQLKEGAHADKSSSRAFLNFIYHENELGNISRQELVSQIPVLLLDVKPHHKVLDMCASPGSKTKQVLSLLHSRSDLPKNQSNNPLPGGLVIANEVDPARCDKLSTNLKKNSSPCLITVNQDAQIFPNIYLYDESTQEKKCIKYDRIVCDVPCSGDGTIRKNPTVWQDWTPGTGNSRHHLQYNIVERGAELLEVGGLIAYSSCAINPVENEAVIGRLLTVADGALELIDVSNELPGLNWAPGHTSWHVLDSKMNQYNTYEDVPESLRDTAIRKSMFSYNYPPDLHLERAMRLLPHHNDCGGFFVAILKKTASLPWEVGRITEMNINEFDLSRRVRSMLKGASENYEKSKKIRNRKLTSVDSRSKPVGAMTHHPNFYSFLESNDEEIENEFKFYDLPERENFVDTSLLFTAYGNRRQVYLTNKTVKNILKANVIGENRNTGLNVFYAGSKVLQKESKTMSCIKHKGNSNIT